METELDILLKQKVKAVINGVPVSGGIISKMRKIMYWQC